MENLNEAIIFYEELDAAQQQKLRAALREDPVWAEAFRQWRQFRAELRQSLGAHLSEDRLLVLYALAEDRSEVLSPRERQELAQARPRLEAALQAHPALHDAVRRIQAGRTAFDRAWAAHVPESASEIEQEVRRGRPAAAPRPRGLRRAWRAAAVLAVLAFAAVLVLVLQRDGGMITVRTAPGEVRLVTLGDGSTVRLLGGAQLSYTSPEKASLFDRYVRLEGKAYFEVVPAEQNFTVEMPTARAVVLGTSFGIQADEHLAAVVLASGRLALAPKGGADHLVVLEPGQMSRVAAGALPATPVPVDLAEALDWTGMFVFRAAPIEDIAARLSRHYGAAVEVAPALVGERVTGTFEQGRSREDVLQALAAALGAAVEPDPSGGHRLVPAAE